MRRASSAQACITRGCGGNVYCPKVSLAGVQEVCIVPLGPNTLYRGRHGQSSSPSQRDARHVVERLESRRNEGNERFSMYPHEMS